MEALRGQKRSVELSSSGVSNSAVPDISSAPKTDTNSNQKESGAQRKKARLDALKAEVASLKQGEGQRGQGSRQAAEQDKDVRPRVKDEEWKKMLGAAPKSKKCRFWNSSVGCHSRNCPYEHVCLVDEEAHRWVDRHFTR